MASRPCLALLATLVASQFASTDGVVSVTSGRVSRVKLRGAGTTPPPELSLTWHAQGQVSDSSALGHALTEPVAATSGVTRQRTSSIAEQAMQFTWPGTGEKAFEAAVDKLGLDAGPMCIWREMVGTISPPPTYPQVASKLWRKRGNSERSVEERPAPVEVELRGSGEGWTSSALRGVYRAPQPLAFRKSRKEIFQSMRPHAAQLGNQSRYISPFVDFASLLRLSCWPPLTPESSCLNDNVAGWCRSEVGVTAQLVYSTAWLALLRP